MIVIREAKTLHFANRSAHFGERPGKIIEIKWKDNFFSHLGHLTPLPRSPENKSQPKNRKILFFRQYY